MPDKKMQILIIEDNPSDAALIKSNLFLEADTGIAVTVEGRLSEGMKAASNKKFDVVLLDMSLPDSMGLDSLVKFREAQKEPPVIVLTGLENNELSIKALQAGAQDYLVKDYADGRLLRRSIMYAIERKTLEDKIIRANRELTGIVDNMPLVSIITGPDRIVRRVNKRALEFFGKSEEEIVGKPAGEAVGCANMFEGGKPCGENSACKRCPIRLVLDEAFSTNRNSHRVEVNVPLMEKKGKEIYVFYISVSLMNFRNEKMAVVSFEDITLRKRTEQRMIESLNRLREIEKLKTNFISSVSHELRTPLTAMKGFLTFLLRGAAGELEPRQMEFVEIINNNMERQFKLVNELLDFGKIEAGTFIMDKKRVNVKKLMLDAINEMNVIASAKEMEIIVGTMKEDVFTTADPERIMQVLINLFNNAVKFSEKRTFLRAGMKIFEDDFAVVPAHIAAVLDAAIRYLHIYVSDEGPGIEKSELTRIFDSYYQSDSSGMSKKFGMGLGLNITRSIVEAHGGFIWAESEGKGKGSVFKILLPLI